jgi:CBS domain-containing protein
MSKLDTVTVADYMTRDVTTLTPDMEVLAAIHLLIRNGYSGCPVVEHGKLIGMLSEKDCLKVALTAGLEGTAAGTVREFMSSTISSLTPETTILEAATKFMDAHFKRYPVIKDGKLVGQLSRSDVLRAIHDLS